MNDLEHVFQVKLYNKNKGNNKTTTNLKWHSILNTKTENDYKECLLKLKLNILYLLFFYAINFQCV